MHKFTFTPAQVDHLKFAALCQIAELEKSREAREPEVVDAIRELHVAMEQLEQARPDMVLENWAQARGLS